MLPTLTNIQTKYSLEYGWQKEDQHAGGKRLIHATKHHWDKIRGQVTVMWYHL